MFFFSTACGLFFAFKAPFHQTVFFPVMAVCFKKTASPRGFENRPQGIRGMSAFVFVFSRPRSPTSFHLHCLQAEGRHRLQHVNGRLVQLRLAEEILHSGSGEDSKRVPFIKKR